MCVHDARPSGLIHVDLNTVEFFFSVENLAITTADGTKKLYRGVHEL
eukprot:COSAG02_NODE_20442_length_832_cov_0.542974_1_plen_46_part_01